MALSYLFRIVLNSACTACSGQFLYLLAFLPSFCVHFLSLSSSFDHHRFDFEHISVMGTARLIVFCNAIVSLSHSRSSAIWVPSLFGTPKLAISFSSVERNSSQSTSLKLLDLCSGVLSRVRSNVVSIGT